MLKYWGHVRAGAVFASNRGGHRKHVLEDYIMRVIARTTRTIEVEGEDGVRYFIDTRDKGVSWPVYLHGSFEADVMDTIVRSWRSRLAEHSLGGPSLISGRTSAPRLRSR